METANSGNKAEEELDKFKRRLIRAVARLVVHEKQPEPEIWTSLKKETNCDCKLLWSRMRALTLKKLKKLFEANDCIDLIPKAARMSLTDWLLFDLVLVHQKIDVIGQENPTKEDPAPLNALFELVKMFKIEGQMGESLADAWSEATLFYNNQGHQCSPMLLQRRWYQLKEVTRTKFYDFWYAYRGAAKRLAYAQAYMPSPLQAAIARKYKTIVTSPFYDWDSLINMRLITLPEEFERKMMERTVNKSSPKLIEDGPDLVMIEPNIETIDLRPDSDTEESTQVETPQPTPVRIKEEPQDPDIDIDETNIQPSKRSIYDEVLESTTLEHEKIDRMFNQESGLACDEALSMIDEPDSAENDAGDKIERNIEAQDTLLPQITSVFGNVSDATALCNFDNGSTTDVGHETNGDNIEDSNVHDNITSVVENVNEVNNLDESSGDGSDNVDDAISENVEGSDSNKGKKFGANNELGSIVTSDHSNIDELVKEPDEKLALKTPISDLANGRKNTVDDVEIIKHIAEPVTITDSDEADVIEPDTNEPDTIKVKPDINESNNANKDESMEVDEKPYIEHFTFTGPQSSLNEDAIMDDDSRDKKLDIKPKIESFSFGELSNDISFADGIEFIDDGIAYHEEEDNERHEENAEDTPKIDEKLLMCPVIYTMRLDDMGLFREQRFDHVDGKLFLDTIDLKSKPIKHEPTSTPPASSDEDDDRKDAITENQRVKPTSYLLQKPRYRSYNPIQLCKNPDFNTRLKRLTVGFFSSPRNCVLMKSCKPLTIDLSKAFESKLVSGTLYLKPTDDSSKSEIVIDDTENQNVSVVPSAMPAQSLIDYSKIGDIQIPSKVATKPAEDVGSLNERNKIINLPDISEIRRINQRLLTAEVTPIRVQNNECQVPVSLLRTYPSMEAPVTTDIRKTFDSRGPPKFVEITDDSPAPTANVANQPSTFDNINPNKLVNEAPVQTAKMQGRPPKMVNGKRVMPPKLTSGPWKPRFNSRPQIPWLTTRKSSKTAEANIASKQIDETLLTIDTLNKMLYLFAEKKEFVPLGPKKGRKKKKNSWLWEDQDVTKLPADSSDDSVICGEVIKTSSQMDNTNNSQNQPPRMPKINIKSAVNDRCKKKTLNKTANTATNVSLDFGLLKEGVANFIAHPRMGDDDDQNNSNEKFCCWSRQRILQLLHIKKDIPSHGCARLKCKCCCKIYLEKVIVNTIAGQATVSCECMSSGNVSQGVIEIDGTDNNQGVDVMEIQETLVQGTIEATVQGPTAEIVQIPVGGVVQVPVEGAIQLPEAAQLSDVRMVSNEGSVESSGEGTVQIINCEASNTESTSDTTGADNEPIDIDAMDTDADVPTMGGEVSVTTTRETPPVLLRGVKTPVNVTGSITLMVPYLKSVTSIKPGIPLNIATVPSNVPPVQAIQPAPPTTSLSTFLAAKKLKRPNRFKKSMSKKPPPITLTQPQGFKEKLIFLNSKQIKEKPGETPIFLGKNKILLTTVKFPSNLKKFEEAQVALAATLNLPKGVKLICTPNGTISYTIDSNVDVNPSDVAKMPAIVAAVETFMEMSNKRDEELKATKEGEVVDLVDDDDDTPKNENAVTPATIVQITECNEISIDDTPDDKMPEIVSHKEATTIPVNTNNDISDSSRNENTEKTSVETQTNEVMNASEKTYSINNEPSTNDDQESNLSSDVLNQNNAQAPSHIDSQVPISNDPEKLTLKGSNQTDDQESVQNDGQDSFCSEVEEPRQKLGQNPIEKDGQKSIQNSSKSSEQILETPVESTQQATKVNVESASEPNKGNKSKNILSDLMEMSGIFDEDITPTEEAQPGLQMQTQGVILHTLLDSSQPKVSDKPMIHPVVMPKPDFSIFRKYVIPPVVKSSIGDLSPITSLYELKYACLNKGLFFKLDFETGCVVPINVRLKPNFNKNIATPLLTPNVNIAPKVVIDLTEDEENCPKSSTSPTRSLLISNNASIANTSTNPTGQVKPVRLFKSLKPNILQRMNHEKVKAIERIKKKKEISYKLKRKQELMEIDLSLNSDDVPTNTDAPLRKYVKRSKLKKNCDVEQNDAEPLEQRIEIPPGTIEKDTKVTTSDDSSDEEPLSVIAKRKREKEIDLAPEHVYGGLDVYTDEDVEISENCSKAMEASVILDINATNSEGAEEDCILGV